jgi:hypothetical protein
LVDDDEHFAAFEIAAGKRPFQVFDSLLFGMRVPSVEVCGHAAIDELAVLVGDLDGGKDCPPARAPAGLWPDATAHTLWVLRRHTWLAGSEAALVDQKIQQLLV